jgi:hypothetical protein
VALSSEFLSHIASSICQSEDEFFYKNLLRLKFSIYGPFVVEEKPSEVIH